VPYIFPTRRLRDEDVLDPTQLTDDFTHVAEALSGRLGSHNISQTVDLSHAQRAEGTLYKVRYTSKEKNPAFGEPPYRAPGTTSDATQLILSNAMQWQSIISKEFTLSAPSKIWINGTLQYCWKGFTDGPKEHFPGHDYSLITGRNDWYKEPSVVYGARVQFAIRVNGRVLEWTITGSQTPYQQANDPNKPVRQKSDLSTSSGPTTSQFPGPAHARISDRSSMGPEALPLRIGSVFEVPGGDNTIEIVARREHDTRFSRDWGGRTSGNVISLFNRQLLVVDFPSWPGRSTHVDAVDVKGIENEEVLTEAGLNEERLQPLVDQVNDIRSGSLAPAALRYEHFESPVIKHARDSLTPGSSYEHRNIYPGDDSEAVTFFYTNMNRQGWCMLANRATVSTGENDWETNNAFCVLTKSFEFTVSRPSWLIVFADIQLIDVEGPNAKAAETVTERASVRHFGLFRLGYHKEGDGNIEWTLPKVTESFVNSSNAWGLWSGNHSSGSIPHYQMVNENINVPMMMVLDFTDITSPVTIDGIAPFVCGASLGSSDGPYVGLKRASIHAIQIDEG